MMWRSRGDDESEWFASTSGESYAHLIVKEFRSYAPDNGAPGWYYTWGIIGTPWFGPVDTVEQAKEYAELLEPVR